MCTTYYPPYLYGLTGLSVSRECAPFQVPSPDGDFCVCRKWREEQAEMLANKDREETEALEELRNQAKVEIQEWYGRHEEQLTQTKTNNRYKLCTSHV